MVKKQRFFVVIFLNLFIFLAVSVAAAVESHNLYYSAHNEEIVINDKSYKGFLNIYNIENPEIRVSLDQSGANQKDDTVWWLPTLSWGNPNTNRPLFGNPRFRVFVPPGALQINLIMFCAQQSPVKLAARFAQVPDCVNCTPSQNTFTQENSFFFDSFGTQDVHLENAGGHIDIYTISCNKAPDAFTSAPSLTQGGWLYVNVYSEPGAVQNIQYAIKVDKTAYTSWFGSYDQTGDPLGLNINAADDPIPTDPTDPIDPTDPTDPVNPTDPGDAQELSVSISDSIPSLMDPLTVKFTASIANQSSFTGLSYTWDLGGFATIENSDSLSVITPTTGPYVVPAYQTGGDYDVKLVVTGYSAGVFKTGIAHKRITLVDKILKGTIKDTASQTPAANISVYAVDFENTKVYVQKTNNAGEYAFAALAPGNYLLLTADLTGSKFFVTNQTTEVYTIDGTPLTVDFNINTQISSNGSQTYNAGKDYCISNPEKCGIIAVNDNLDIQLKSVEIPGTEDRYDVTFNRLADSGKFGLGPVGISSLVTQTVVSESMANVQSVDVIPTDNPQDFLNHVTIPDTFTVTLTADRSRIHPLDTVRFTPDISNGNDISQYSYLWSFGEGNSGNDVPTPFVEHRYETAGNYQVSLGVWNGDFSHSDWAYTTIIVEKPNSLTGTIFDKITQSPAAGYAVYAIDLANIEIYATKTDANGMYTFDSLFNGTYVLMFGQTNTAGSDTYRFFVTDKTADMYTMQDGALQTVDFVVDSTSPDNEFLALSYEEGMQFCQNNPEECDIIIMEDFDIRLRSVKIPSREDRFDFVLKLSVSEDGQQLYWEPQPPLTGE